MRRILVDDCGSKLPHDSLDQIVHLDRLRHQRVGPHGGDFGNSGRGYIARYGQHALDRGASLAQMPQQFATVHVGQHQIQQQHVVPVVADVTQRRAAILGHVDHCSLRGQQPAHRVSRGFMVFDDQHAPAGQRTIAQMERLGPGVVRLRSLIVDQAGRNPQGERRAVPNFAVHAQRGPDRVDQSFTNGQPQAGALAAIALGVLDLVELVVDMIQMFAGDA